MLTGGRHRHAVHRQHTALLREHPGQIRVIIDHGNGIAGVVHADGRLAADHLIKDLIHNVGLHQRFLRFQGLHHLVHLFRGLGVDTGTVLERCNGVGITAVIEHQNVARVLLVPQVSPFGGGILHHGGVVDDAGGTEHIGHGIGVGGVIIRVAVDRIDVLGVGDVAVIQRCKHSLGDHLCHHVIRRDDHIVVGRTGFQFGVHGLVGIKGGVVDLDAGKLLEGGHHIHAVIGAVGDVFAPVVNVQGEILALKAGPVVIVRDRNVLGHLNGSGGKSGRSTAERHGQRQQQNSKTFHFTFSPLSAF